MCNKYGKNEACVINGLNKDQLYGDHKKVCKKFWLKYICIVNISSEFDTQKYWLKVYNTPEQRDSKSCDIKVMMVIYQIYIQGQSFKKLYSHSNHENFRFLFFHTLFQVAKLVLNDKKRVERSRGIDKE